FDPFLVKPGEKTAINSSYDNCVKASKEEILTSLEDNSDVDVFYFPYEALEDESQNEIMKAIVEAYPDSYVLVETDKKVPSWLCDKLNLLLTDNDALISDSYDTVLMKEGKFDLYKGKNMVSSQDSKKLFETLFTEGKFQGLDKFF
ncbi:MAG: hypothetical protein K6G51_00275, partial [Sphaerochaetaceae bacterium]|nr:hypothetical protein [Sphaerochaetaceae bacterium]